MEEHAPHQALNVPRPARWKRNVKRLAVVAALLLCCAGYVLKDHIRTLGSLRRVPGTQAYVMDYYVDYNIDEVRAHGIDVDHVEDSLINAFFPGWISSIASRVKQSFVPEPVTTLTQDHHCSTVVLRSENGHTYFGRNFDYSHDACLILRIHDSSGVASVAVLDLHYLNLDRDDLEQTNLIQRIPLLFTPYYLHDGMNRHGVAVSEMSVEGVRAPHDSAKPNIIQSTVLRLILDYATTTDEAIEILHQYNIHFVAETCHFLIADRTGKSAVVEFIDGEIKPTPIDKNWQVSTNHQIFGKSEEDNCTACSRYKLAASALNDLRQKGDASDVMTIMGSISVPNWTMWSSVYDLTTGEFQIAYRRQFSDVYCDSISAAGPGQTN